MTVKQQDTKKPDNIEDVEGKQPENVEPKDVDKSEDNSQPDTIELDNLKKELEDAKTKLEDIAKKEKELEDQKKQEDLEAAKKKALEEGDTETLLQLREKDNLELKNENEKLRNEIKNGAVDLTAQTLAAELCDSVKMRKTLVKELKEHLRYTEHGVKHVDNEGKIVATDFEKLKAYAKDEYDYLCDKTHSVGGAGVDISTASQSKENISPLERLQRANAKK